MKKVLPDSIEDLYPLSPTQQGMLFHSIAEQGSGVYIVQAGFSIRGAIKVSVLKEAWQLLVQQHQTLRTAFVWEKVEAPLQVVGKTARIPFEELDWQNAYSLAGAPGHLENWSLYQDWKESDRKSGFTLTRAPLMRLTLMKLQTNFYHLVWSYHHLILDGWSLPLLLKDWTLIYKSILSGTKLQLSSPPSFKKYISWLKNYDQSKSEDYWKKLLSGAYEATRLGLKQNEDSSIGVSKLEQSLDKTLTKKLSAHARKQHLTLSTIIQGAWALLLSQYGDQKDIIFGLARSGRPPELPEYEHGVGLFITTLPIRTQVDQNASLFDWLRTLQSQQLEQQPFESTPLAKVRALSQSPKDQPLFNSVVVFENYPLLNSRLKNDPSLAFSDVILSEQTNYPLSLYAIAGESLELRLLFPKNHFSKTEIRAFLDSYLSILRSIAKLETYTSEIKNLLPTFQPPVQSIGPRLEKHSLINTNAAFMQQTQSYPEKKALIFQDESISYSELTQRVDCLAQYLHSLGIKEGDPVGILLPRSLEIVIALLATFRIGAYYIPLDPSHPKARLEMIREDCNMKVLIVNHESKSILSDNGTNLINLSLIDLSQTSKNQPLDLPHNDLQSLAYTIYTSGTTGKPKGVKISHLNLANFLVSMQKRLDFSAQRRCLAVTTIAFDIAVLELLLPLTTGGTVIIASKEEVLDGEKLVELIQKHNIDTLQSTPSGWQTILPHWSKMLPSNKPSEFTILCGGEPLDLTLAKKLCATGASIWNVYGPTETTIWSGALQLNDENLANDFVPIGAPLNNTSFYLLDSKHKHVPTGVTGEIFIGGLGLSPGYHNRHDLNQERYRSIDVNGEFTRLYQTGDLARYHADGTLEFLGRTDGQIKLRGHRIELAEIEVALQSHPSIDQAIVVLQHKGTPEARLLAAIKTKISFHGQELNQELRNYLLEKLPTYMLPTVYHPIESFPLTPNKKIDRRALEKLEILSKSNKKTPPRTQVEKQLATIWYRILQIDSPNIHDNFFEIGGHSLLVLRARSEIREKLGIELAITDFFNYPTLHSLANHLSQLNESSNMIQDRQDALSAGKLRLKQRRTQRPSQQPTVKV
ncbi:MAG: amino acid adenylation domain-containing protein [Verrucomicrobiota bacterium]